MVEWQTEILKGIIQLDSLPIIFYSHVIWAATAIADAFQKINILWVMKMVKLPKYLWS